MPKARQHMMSERPVWQHRPVEGRLISRDEIERSLAGYGRLERVAGSYQFYQSKLWKLYESLPEEKAIRHGTPDGWREKLLSFVRRDGRRPGPAFLSRDGRPMHRASLSGVMKAVREAVQLIDGRTNPKGLQKLYPSNRAPIEADIALLVEQGMERQLGQFSVGWEEC